jgi:hypothetical protein
VNQQGTGKIFELQDSGTARITVLDGGNVGIGIANPTQKLYVVGDTRIEGNLTVNGTQTVINTDVITTEQLLVTNNGTGPALVVNQTGEQPVVDIQDDGVSVMKIINNGNIGMGTTDPTQRLHVQGSILATTQHLGPAADTSNAPGFSWSGDSNTGIYRPAADAVGVVTGGVERMRVLSNGNVGIGTTNPKASTHVQSSFAFNTDVNGTNYGGLLASSAVSNGDINTYGGQIVFQQKWFSGSEGLVSTGCIAGVKTVGGGNYGGGLAFLSTPLGGDYMIERLRILDTGNVGIGTTNPSEKLQVNGNINAIGTLYLNNNAHIKENNGYTALPGGLLLQWGRSQISLATNQVSPTQTFPKAFSATPYSVTANFNDVGYGYSAPTTSIGVGFNATTLTFNIKTSSPISSPGLYCFWMAIGPI